MADNSNETVVQMSHSYVDSAAVKKFIVETLVPAYFPDVDVSIRSSGMLGMTSDIISTIAEDGFNMSASLFRETFPNRAELPESIYSHAAIFQKDIGFANPSACTFLLILDEHAITDEGGAVYDRDTGFYNFYVDRDTTVYVEDVPYVLDYDIVIKYVIRQTEKGKDYIFTAQYTLDSRNFISSINDPYIKIRRSANGLLALEVKMHQCVRDIRYEPIVNNATINLPVIDVPYDGVLAGFDVFYRTAETEEFTQLKTLLVHGQPLTTPFCYYQKYDDSVMRFTFNGDDTYFIPQFNSELKIVLYITRGSVANFNTYTGTNINITPDTSVHDYDFTFIVGARVVGGSTGGTDSPSIEAVKALTVEGYRTAEALTTDADLNEFFSNYKYRYGDAFIKFIKRRNDIVERIFGAFILMQRNDYIFKTNTLDIHMNISDMENPDHEIYMIEPGTLFVYDGDSCDTVTFMRDESKTSAYMEEYLEAVKNNEIPYLENPPTDNIPAYLDRPASFAEFKRRKGYVDRMIGFDVSPDELSKLEDVHGYVYATPFMIRVKKNPNIVSLYLTFINQTSVLDFTNQNDSMQVQFVLHEAKLERSLMSHNNYKITTAVMPTVTVSQDYPLVKSYGGDIKNVINNDLRVVFVVYDSGRPVCFTELQPISTENGTIRFEGSLTTTNYITSDGVLCMTDGQVYVEPNIFQDTNGYLYKEDLKNSDVYRKYTEAGVLVSDEQISYDDILAMVDSGRAVVYSNNGDYFEVSKTDQTKYYHYHKDGTPFMTEAGVPVLVPVDVITAKKNALLVYSYANTIQTDARPTIQIPMEDVVCRIYTLYNRRFNEDLATLSPIGPGGTDNPVAQYVTKTPTGEILDPYHDYSGYVWTNEYTSLTEPFTFVRPLNHVRGTMYYDDYTQTTNHEEADGTITTTYDHDIMDLTVKAVPLVKWSLVYDEDNLSYFMNSFIAQYEAIDEVVNNRIRNETGIDAKFYNTYGRSKTYCLSDGRSTEILDKINLKIKFDIWFISGTDLFTAVPDVQRYVKAAIEALNSDGTNALHISNLMRKMELAFPYIDHIRFSGINDYSPHYQSIYTRYPDLNDMEKEERRGYVPEMLVVDLDDIIIDDTLID